MFSQSMCDDFTLKAARTVAVSALKVSILAFNSSSSFFFVELVEASTCPKVGILIASFVKVLFLCREISRIFKISRERERLRKSSAACKSEELYKSVISSFPPEDQTGRKPGLEVVKKKIKSAMADETSKDQLAHTKKLISRRGLLELLQTMDQDAT